MRDKPVIVHFCNTCAHVMKTTKEEPCKSCRQWMEDIRNIDDLIEKLKDAVAVLTLEDIYLLIRSLETYKNEQKTATDGRLPEDG